MQRRDFVARGAALIGGLALWPLARAETYLSVAQAQQILFPGIPLTRQTIRLSKEQQKRIAAASRERVRNLDLNVWKSAADNWFIVDNVIGKHENIDMAVGIDAAGKISGVEILTYRESYGYEVRNGKWRAQFHGRDHNELLKLDKQIKNISGATLSCRHVTDGINRLTHTWNEVLRTL